MSTCAVWPLWPEDIEQQAFTFKPPKSQKKKPTKKQDGGDPTDRLACTNATHCDRCAAASASHLLLEQTHACCGETVCFTRSQEFTDIMNAARVFPSNVERRYNAYQLTDRERNGIGTLYVHRPLPRCVLVYIRRVWPSAAYTGYIP